jgi:sugar/nucleoside kinase (ribokinase family)
MALIEGLEGSGKPLLHTSGSSVIADSARDEYASNQIFEDDGPFHTRTDKNVRRRVSISSGDALLLQGNLSLDPTLHAAKRAKQAGAKVIFNAAPYRDWCKTMSCDVDVSDCSH